MKTIVIINDWNEPQSSNKTLTHFKITGFQKNSKQSEIYACKALKMLNRQHGYTHTHTHKPQLLYVNTPSEHVFPLVTAFGNACLSVSLSKNTHSTTKSVPTKTYPITERCGGPTEGKKGLHDRCEWLKNRGSWQEEFWHPCNVNNCNVKAF